MVTATLYILVSPDEQAQKGYSQRSQEEKLNKYCKDNHIEIAQTIFEDHSARVSTVQKIASCLLEFKKPQTCGLNIANKLDRLAIQLSSLPPF
jgi:DNA invertase Pin-like site-specific DNA recombinase